MGFSIWRRPPARWLPRGLATGLVLALAAACSTGSGARSLGSARAWAEGPVRWLMLPEEERAFRRVGTNAEALVFIEDFWRRRDPDPGTPGNRVAEEFFERVQAADLLYGSRGLRGSLTPRGRAFILLGSPSHLNLERRTVPLWEPGPDRPTGPGSATRELPIEIWGYGPNALSPSLVALLDEELGQETIELVFALAPDEVRLLAGERYLELAARSAVREPP